MKPTYFLPVLTAAVGFAVAWLAKPDSVSKPGATIVSDAAAPKRDSRSSTAARAVTSDGKRPKEVNTSDFPLTDQADLGPKTRDEGKMLRLTEALGLSVDQQGAIIALIEEVQAKANPDVSVIEDLTTRGMAVEEGLNKLLSADQLAKFQEIRERERENRIEQRAQVMLVPALEDIDMSPQQREEVVGRLRQKARADLQAIPAAATLLFDKSILPTNNQELSVDGILVLTKAAEPMDPTNPEITHKRVQDSQRQELEDVLRCFDGVLTPGQMSQYQAALNIQRNLFKRMPPTERSDASPPGAPVIEVLPEGVEPE